MLLLVSVTDADEARLALAGGADIVDAKDPAAGALGAVSPAQLAAIRAAVPLEIPMSAAFGDMTAIEEIEEALSGIQLPVTLIKIGFLAASPDDLEMLLIRSSQIAAHLPGNPGIVAVAYADHTRVIAPSPTQIIAAAQTAGIEGVLVDTVVKDSGSLFGYLSSATLREWSASLASEGMFLAIAGSLAFGDLAAVGETGASVAGVRGAACLGGRMGRISVPRVRGLRAQLTASMPERPESSAAMSWLSRSTSPAARQRHHIPLASATEK